MIDELFEYGVYLALLVALAIPLSAYLNKVMAGQKTSPRTWGGSAIL